MTAPRDRAEVLALVDDRAYLQVRPALVRAVGANGAAVLTLIRYREEHHLSHEHDGRRWWRASYDDIADGTGLSRDQVKRALSVLVRDGWIEAEQHRRGGNGDRTFSYCVACLDEGENPGIIHRANSPYPSGEIALSDRANSPDLPSIETVETPPYPPEGGGTLDPRAGYPVHLHEPNAVSALTRARAERALPLDASDLLRFAYRIGAGDPWAGWREMDTTTNEPLDGARDRAAVLRHRLEQLAPRRTA